MPRWFTAVCLVAVSIGVPSILCADPVQYVKICSLYGVDFYYDPGTDVCVNALTGETRQQTELGTWFGTIPGPGSWVTGAKEACKGGRLVRVGTFTSSDFTQVAAGKYETPLFSLKLGPEDFIANVILNGGFDVTEKSTFCLSFFDPNVIGVPHYAVIGCQNTARMQSAPGTWSFAPFRTVPPAEFAPPFQIVGYNANENWGDPPVSFNGTLSCWVCVQHAERKDK